VFLKVACAYLRLYKKITPVSVSEPDSVSICNVQLTLHSVASRRSFSRTDKPPEWREGREICAQAFIYTVVRYVRGDIESPDY